MTFPILEGIVAFFVALLILLIINWKKVSYGFKHLSRKAKEQIFSFIGVILGIFSIIINFIRPTYFSFSTFSTVHSPEPNTVSLGVIGFILLVISLIFMFRRK